MKKKIASAGLILLIMIFFMQLSEGSESSKTKKIVHPRGKIIFKNYRPPSIPPEIKNKISISQPKDTTYLTKMSTIQGTGTLAGWILDTSNNGIEGLYVNVYEEDDLLGFSIQGDTDYDGYFEIDDIPPGRYKIEISTWWTNYISECFNNKPTLEKGDVVTIYSGYTTWLYPYPVLEIGGKFTGKVTDSTGKGLSGIGVTAYDSNFNFINSNATDANGNYFCGGLPTGSFKIKYGMGWKHIEDGSNYKMEWYNNKDFFEDAQSISITKGATKALGNVVLSTGGILKGRIVKQNSNGIPDAYVSVFSYSAINSNLNCLLIIENTTTDSNGFYEVKGLPTGTYLVHFSASNNFIHKFYNNVLYVLDASPVSITAGQTTDLGNTTLVKGGYVSGKVTDAYGYGLKDVTVYLYDAGTNSYLDYHWTQTDASGNYKVDQVRPGKVKANFWTSRMSSGNYKSEFYSNKMLLSNATSVNVSSGQTVTLNASLEKGGGKIIGWVRDTKGKAYPDVRLRLYEANNRKSLLSSFISDSVGYLRFRGLNPGKYKVFAGDFNAPPFVEEWYKDKSSFTSATEIEVTGGEKEINITLGGSFVTDPPKVHVIAVGPIDYENSKKKKGILRCDEDAETIFNIISLFPNYATENDKREVLITGDIRNENEEIRIDTYAALNYLKDRVSPGDTLIIYISSHGGDDPNGNETSQTPGDEGFVLGNNALGLLMDDELVRWFNKDMGNKFFGVNKLFFFDSCQSGGFWGNNNPDDEGDLEKLDKVGMIAATNEKGNSGAINGRGIFTYALADALRDSKSLDINKIYDLILNWEHWHLFDGCEAVKKDDNGTFLFNKSDLSILKEKTTDFNPSINIQSTFKVLSPDFRSLWQAGKNNSIKWKTTGSVAKVKVQLFKSGSVKNTITSSLSNTGSFNWTIPSGLQEGDDYSIKIMDASDASVSSMSALFSIKKKAVIEVQSPMSLSEWPIGSTRKILWKTSNGISKVSIKLYKNNSYYKTLASSANNNGSYTWNISTQLTLGNYYKIIVVNTADSSVYGASEKFSLVSKGKIKLSKNQLTFGSTTSGTSSASQRFMISSSGSTLNWTISKNQTWISCSPTSGTGSGTVSVSVNPSGLSAGTYTGTISVSDPGATNSPQTVNVTLTVYANGQTAAPFGTFATPKDGTTARGSIPVTGWVLDDLEVESVKIYSGKNYIGTALFVEGARPDVEAAYPDYPNNYKAGWGYMLLTNFLADGKYTLYAKARDIDGHEITLGSKKITIDNANAVKPFGAIDTPAQGGTASGSSFVNWGWVLTPQPNSIPTNGSTIDVWVNGVNLGHPTYNIYRSDIGNKFPGYANSNGAIGYFYLDTTAYANGVHTIQWTARDTGGNTDGIGSRYFTIQNTGGDAKASVAMGHRQLAIGGLSSITVDNAQPVFIRKGFNKDINTEVVDTDGEGKYLIKMRECNRLQISLFENDFSSHILPLASDPLPINLNNIEVFHIVNNQLRKPPVGMSINQKTGTITWMPGAGYFGRYRFTVVVMDKKGDLYKKFLDIIIKPKFDIQE